MEHNVNNVLQLIDNKEFDQAKICLNNLIEKEPDNGFLYNILGYVFTITNHKDLAIKYFKIAILKDKNLYPAFFNLGVIFLEKKILEQAIFYFKEATLIKDDYYDAFLNLGLAYSDNNQFEDSINAFKKCIILNSKAVESYNNLGIVYLKQENYPKALEIISIGTEADPNFFGIYNNLGLAYLGLKNFERAIINFNKAINLKIDFYEAYTNLADTLNKIGDYDAALNICNQSIEVNKNFYKSYQIKSLILKNLNKYYEAIENSHKSLVLKKDFNSGYILLGSLYTSIAKHDLGLEYFEKLDEQKTDSDEWQYYIFNSNYIYNFDKQKYLSLTKKFENSIKVIEKSLLKDFCYTQSFDKVKIAFISGDFRDHPITYQLKNFFYELKLSNEFEIFGYNNNKNNDVTTNIIRSSFDHWHEVYNYKDLDLINLIRSDGIHVLIDLSGHSAKNRLSALSYRVAPVQISWAGYLSSTGLKNFDYFIGDKYTIPKEEEIFYSEKIIRLSKIWTMFSPPDYNVIKSTEPPIKKNNYITFGSFNNLAKISNHILGAWKKILINIPNARIFLKDNILEDERVKNDIYLHFADSGIEKNRIILQGADKREVFLQSYNKVDISLDTFPYGGGTTNLESIWMGVPILTLSGPGFLSRCGESINSNLGLNDWICRDKEDYVKKAINFSSNIELLSKIKKNLLLALDNNIIFSPQEFTFDFINLIKNVFIKHQKIKSNIY